MTCSWFLKVWRKRDNACQWKCWFIPVVWQNQMLLVRTPIHGRLWYYSKPPIPQESPVCAGVYTCACVCVWSWYIALYLWGLFFFTGGHFVLVGTFFRPSLRRSVFWVFKIWFVIVRVSELSICQVLTTHEKPDSVCVLALASILWHHFGDIAPNWISCTGLFG